MRICFERMFSRILVVDGIAHLPTGLFPLRNLETSDSSFNSLVIIRPLISQRTSLVIIYFGSNEIKAVPSELFRLPTLPLCSSHHTKCPPSHQLPRSPNPELSLGFVVSLRMSMMSETIRNMETSSCCTLSSGVPFLCVELADLCASASLAISELNTLSLVGNGIWELPFSFFLSLPNLRRVELSLSELTPTINRNILASQQTHWHWPLLFRVRLVCVNPPAQNDCSEVSLLFVSFVDCSLFLNWNEGRLESDGEVAAVFRSLVATLKLQPTVDDSLEGKAAKFLKYMRPYNIKSTTAFLHSFASNSDKSLNIFIQSIVVLISSLNQTITTTAILMLSSLMEECSIPNRFALIKVDLIPHLINTLNPPSLSIAETVDIHTCLMKIIRNSLWLTTTDGLEILENEDRNEQLAVREIIFKQALFPSEKYICHLCMNRFSIVDETQSEIFLMLLTVLLQICPYHQPTMDIVLNMPVFLTIPSCLTFFENDLSIWRFVSSMFYAQRELNKTRGEVQQMWKTVHRMLRMEGSEDVMEEKSLNDRKDYVGRVIVADSIRLISLLGMNIPEQE
ncbi:hypothetical protein BLNAU_17204 [Blattamonas nauphoetae]|uniref:Uncharacterized protein n=1 Tax=Blattamonas nauphoetae TaxID=2049346 RepID=A0ABQ9X914_9EUKA|nr:hypothetical protein BLNAU_17204 [Blattamonas nauphoetae]